MSVLNLLSEMVNSTVEITMFVAFPVIITIISEICSKQFPYAFIKYIYSKNKGPKNNNDNNILRYAFFILYYILFASTMYIYSGEKHSLYLQIGMVIYSIIFLIIYFSLMRNSKKENKNKIKEVKNGKVI